jgi:hypothetical protein
MGTIAYWFECFHTFFDMATTTTPPPPEVVMRGGVLKCGPSTMGTVTEFESLLVVYEQTLLQPYFDDIILFATCVSVTVPVTDNRIIYAF